MRKEVTQILGGVELHPLGVVEIGAGVSRIIAGMDQPSGGQIGGLAQICGVKALGVEASCAERHAQPSGHDSQKRQRAGMAPTGGHAAGRRIHAASQGSVQPYHFRCDTYLTRFLDEAEPDSGRIDPSIRKFWKPRKCQGKAALGLGSVITHESRIGLAHDQGWPQASRPEVIASKVRFSPRQS